MKKLHKIHPISLLTLLLFTPHAHSSTADRISGATVGTAFGVANAMADIMLYKNSRWFFSLPTIGVLSFFALPNMRHNLAYSVRRTFDDQGGNQGFEHAFARELRSWARSFDWIAWITTLYVLLET